MAIVEHLEKTKLFDKLNNEEIKLFLERFQKASFNAGDCVFKENDKADTLYIVEKGTVSITKRIIADVEKKLLVAREGLIFGEFSFMDVGIRSASAVVEEDTDLIILNRSDFDAFIEENPSTGIKLYNNLLYIVVERLRRTNDAYRDAVRWGVELTGTQALNFHYLITEDVEVCIELTSKRILQGKVIQLERSDAGYQVIIVDRDGNPTIIPYHAVVSVAIAQQKSQ